MTRIEKKPQSTPQWPRPADWSLISGSLNRKQLFTSENQL